MSSRSVTSSDLELARTLSRRLSGAQTSGQPPAPTGPGYVRFAPRPVAAVPVAAQPAGMTVELVRFDTWDKLLDSCLSLTRATTAFVMDPENHQRQSREWRGAMRHFYAMPWESHYIWGVTAGILRNMYERLYI